MKKILLPLALILPLTACTSATGDTDGELNIVASTQVWADVAEETLPGVDVHAIVLGDSDPHSFEPSASDMARVEAADIILVGGGGYDSWLYDSLEGDDRIISAMDLEPHDHNHDHDKNDHSEKHADGHSQDHGDLHETDNEHIWYSPEAVSKFAEDLAEKVLEVSPDTPVSPDAVATQMADLSSRIAKLPAARIAQTEPIADHLLAHSPMIESTPEGYRATTLSEGEPTASDVAAFHKVIEEGGIDILIYNPQSASPVATSIKDLALETDIPVVEIAETPEVDGKFLDTFTTAVTDLEQAGR